MHTHRSHTLPLTWKLWLSTAHVFSLLHFRPIHVQQTDKALFKVQCTLWLLHCHQKPLTKCLISLWGYLFLVHLPNGTFSSGTWNFPFDHLCYTKSVTGHNIFYRKLKDSCSLRWLGVFKLVTLTGTHAGEGLPLSPCISPSLAIHTYYLQWGKRDLSFKCQVHLKMKVSPVGMAQWLSMMQEIEVLFQVRHMPGL